MKVPAHPRLHLHPHVHDPEHIKGVRTVATIEFTKGVIVVLAGLGLVSMRHKSIWGVAESLLEFLHVSPYHHYVGVFIDLVSRVSDMRLWKVALVAGVYATLRFVEAYGLWYLLPWAEWMAAITGGIYIPFEVADLIRRPTALRWLILIINAVIVLYMLYLRFEAEEKRRAARKHAIET
ncbi:MAG: DUF2127 domain-containing protein [Terriglobales bacterium]